MTLPRRAVRSAIVIALLICSLAFVLEGVATADPVCDVEPPAGILVPLPTSCDSDLSEDYYAGVDTYVPPSSSDSVADPTVYECEKAVTMSLVLRSDESHVDMRADGNVKCSGLVGGVRGTLQILKGSTAKKAVGFSAGAVPSGDGSAVNAYVNTSWRCSESTIGNYRARVVYYVSDVVGTERGPYAVRTQAFRGRCA